MKRMLLLVCFFACFFSVSVLGEEPRFDNMRTILIVQTNQNTYPARFMKQRLKEPFRIPYWDRMETTEILDSPELTQERMQSLAAAYHADIVIAPVVKTWYWTQRHIFFWHDDEIFTECMYEFSVLAYNAQQHSFKSYSTHGFKRESASILNDPNEILTDAMNALMNKLPYKRIPTDIERPSTVLQTKTTDGGAKILTNMDPIML